MTQTKFDVIIRQEPLVGRMCGVKDTVNRRAIDPPLIIELANIETPDDIDCLSFCNRFICHLNLYSEDHENSMYFRQVDSRPLRNMLGDATASAIPLHDPQDDELKLFFIFHNISIRKTGMYYFSCDIIDVESGLIQTKNTNCFKIYNNKEFPGNAPCTTLSRSFISQGIRIRFKPQIKNNDCHYQQNTSG
ncbi:velvet factor [Globomyces pollinis-pini]|nr:velvet factor [Globomyces pollinis-pini]